MTYTHGWSALIRDLATARLVYAHVSLDMMVSLAKELLAQQIAMAVAIAFPKRFLPQRLAAFILSPGMLKRMLAASVIQGTVVLPVNSKSAPLEVIPLMAMAMNLAVTVLAVESVITARGFAHAFPVSLALPANTKRT